MIYMGPASGLRSGGVVWEPGLQRRTAMGDQIQPWPVLRRGSRGHPVPALQYLLRDRGHAVTVDGVFGPRTRAVVLGFQRALGITADGIVGPVTWRALVSGMLSL
jgi:peptidoglycan hydrolase-like protein with peptidoglycan-binding domain